MSTEPTEVSQLEEYQVQDCCSTLEEMKESMSSVREVIKSLQKKCVTESYWLEQYLKLSAYRVSAPDFDLKDGISLLSVKSHLMVSYLQSLVLLSARRALGDSLAERTPPTEPFSSTSRGTRGSGAGDRVDSMIEGRVTLEKIKALESKMKYQIEKLVRVAEESAEAAKNAVNGMFPIYIIYGG